MRKRSFLGLLIVCFLALLAVPAWAQGEMHKSVYTYVSEWAVPRAMWPEMAKLQAANDAANEKFLADGTITSYGDYVNLVHQEGEPTHGDWIQSNSIGGILRVIAASTGTAGRQDPVLAASKHWDYFLQSDANEVGVHSGSFTNAYLRVFTVRVKLGADEQFEKSLKAYIEPLYRQLMSEGVLVYYDVDREYVQSSPSGAVGIVTIATSADAMDKYVTTTRAAFEKNPAIGAAFRESTEPGTFRSYLYVVPFAKFK